MRFPEWIEKQPRGTLKRIERDTGVGYSTLHRARTGEAISRYDTAKLISEATGGVVSVPELCEPPSPPPTS